VHAISGGPDIMPDSGFDILPEHRAVHAGVTPRVLGHILTGPIAIAGAEPGDMLEVRILDIAFRQDWGWNVIRPPMGALLDDFPERRLLHIPIDRGAGWRGCRGGSSYRWRRSSGSWEWGVHAVSTDAQFGGWIFDRRWRGLRHGTRNRALEHLRTGHPQAGSARHVARRDPTHVITMGIDSSLGGAAKQALREMIVPIRERTDLSGEDAYSLCRLAADLHVTQVVTANKGVHMILAKTALHGPA